MSLATTSLQGFQQFMPPGPVAAAFLEDRTHDARFLRGPVGGGKTVTCIFDSLSNATQMPVCVDGWVHYRLAVLGSTYGQLERNLYPSWTAWLAKDGGDWTEGEWVGGGGRFARHELKFWSVRGSKKLPVRFEAIFGAIGDLSVEQFVRGFEPTAWYLFECDQLPSGIVDQCLGRLSRYPSAKMLGRQPDYRSYLIGDLNSPDIDSWYHELVMETRPKGLKEYVQPSGLSPRAENLKNLRARNYEILAELNAHNKRWIRRMIHNQFAPSQAGDPVYEEWADDLHYAPDPIAFDPRRPLYLGFDQGLTQPACIVAQRAPNGQWRVLIEVVPGRMNARRFAERVKAELADHCPNATIAGAWADPAGFDGADKEAGEMAWAETVGLELGFPILPAPSNEIDLRQQAVRDELTFMIDGATPGLLVSPRCSMLRKGFASHYMLEKRKPEQSQARKPIKNIWSNPHDALQYLLLGVKGRYGTISNNRDAGMGTHAPPGVVKLKSEFLAGW
ncbi:MAG: hypothetical protein IT536_04450 [Hyphomicrobiales bacterium]|nr:hypothetical protein [Hyphomicrobiales bacterium]